MTTFALDVRFARPRALDGVGRFLWHVAAELPAVLRADERLVLLCLDEDEAAYRAHVPRARVVATRAPIASLAQHTAWPALVREVGADVVHYPQYDLPSLPAGVRGVVTIHDFTPLDDARYFEGHEWRKVAAAALYASTFARAAIVTTMSTTVARDVVGRMPALAARVHVTPPGPSVLRASSMGASATDIGRERGLFVYVGNHRPHKRVDVLVAAFRRARTEVPGARLVLMGRSDPRFPLPPLGDGVSLVEGAADDEIAATLARARGLVFPSIGEGYGFPVAEAQAVGTPSIVVDAGSLPEVAGGGGLVVPAGDEAALAGAIVRLALDDTLWAAAAARAVAVHQARSWGHAAEALIGAWRAGLSQ